MKIEIDSTDGLGILYFHFDECVHFLPAGLHKKLGTQRSRDRGSRIADRGFGDRGSRRDRGKNSDTEGFFLGICGVRKNVVFCVEVRKKS